MQAYQQQQTALQRAALEIANGWSAARKEGAIEVLRQLEEAYITAAFERSTVLRAQHLFAQTDSKVRELQHAVNAVRGLQFAPDALDERGRSAVALTCSLMDAFTKGFRVRSVDGELVDSVRDVTETGRLQREIVRTVGYIVWRALGADGDPLPAPQAEQES